MAPTSPCLSQTFQPPPHINLEVLKKAQKKQEIGTSNPEISKICVKWKQQWQIICFRVFSTELVFFAVLFAAFLCIDRTASSHFEICVQRSSFRESLAHRCFTRMKLADGWHCTHSGYPQIILDCYEYRFFNIPSYFPEFFGNFKVYDSLWDFEGKLWESEWASQTVSLTVKPWVSQSNHESWKVCFHRKLLILPGLYSSICSSFMSG